CHYVALALHDALPIWTVTRGAKRSSDQKQSTAAAHVASQTVEWDTPASGEIGWNATTKTLTLQGTIYIDGSAKISNSAVDTYDRSEEHTSELQSLRHL